MFPSFCRRRLLLRIPGEATNLLQSMSIHLAHSSYSSTAVSRVPSSDLCPATVSYLISCGLSPAAAATTATTQRIRIVSPDKVHAVCSLLRDYGFADADIVRTVRSAPSILVADPERILRPKLDFFAALRFEPRKLAAAPCLLVHSLDKNIVPSVQFIRGIVGSDDQLRRGFSRVPWALAVDVDRSMRPAVESLRRCGLDDAAISKLLVIQMGVLMASPDRISEIFQELKAVGMCTSDSRFLYCFSAMCSLKRGAWRRKLAFFHSFGLSEGEVIKAFKTQPMLFLSSDETIKKKLRFLLDEVKLGVSDVIAQPVILSYSLENCILPRCAVLSVLMKEGKIPRDIKLLPALLGSSTVFSTRYVVRHADHVPDVVKAYEGKIKFQGFRHDT
ncbi:transcription termination factor MTERF8, chloroplastic [Lolium perenne]|uniref:transcription termination factor MTERF8, chloroplastic n=1 Tax=Lolium perenne TaxID=4522 RepID=UPI0021EA6EDB|nr:transcription termination factor MTERF8, chloroplastic-like [Lolium perenne]